MKLDRGLFKRRKFRFSKKTEIGGVFADDSGKVRDHEALPGFLGKLPAMPDREAGVLDVLLQFFLSVLAGWSFVHVFTSAFELEVKLLPFLGAVALMSLVSVLLLKRFRPALILLGLLLLGAIGYTFVIRDSAVKQCAGIFARCMESFGEYYDWGNVTVNAEAVTEVTWVIILIAAVPVWQTAYAYGKHVYPSVLAFFFLMPLFIDILGGASPSLVSLALLSLVILTLFVTCHTECAEDEEAVDDSVRRRLRLFQIGIVTAALVAVLALSASVIYPANRERIESFQRKYSTEYFADLLARIKNNPFNISRNGLSEGDLTRAGHVVQNGKKVMTVTTERAETTQFYLRGYAGDLYTGHSWEKSESLPDEAFPEDLANIDLFRGNATGRIYRNPFLYYTAVSASAFVHERDAENTITVAKEIRDNYAYLPYGVNGEITGDTGALEFSQDLSLKNSRKESLVTYPVYTYESIDDIELRIETGGGEVGATQPDGSAVAVLESAEELYQILKADYGVTGGVEKFLETVYSEYVVTDENGTEIHYRIRNSCMDVYEDYVREACLVQPKSEAVLQIASELASTYGIDTADPDISRAVYAVQRYLSENYVYDQNPGETDPEIDFAEDFLTAKKTGYCVHFATAGTLLLRALGVPARYVEGYLVPADGETTSVDITDKNAHAWTEIFIEGHGWYPVEMTYLSEEEGMEEETRDPEESSEDEEGTEPSDESDSDDESSNPEGETTMEDPSIGESASWSRGDKETETSQTEEAGGNAGDPGYEETGEGAESADPGASPESVKNSIPMIIGLLLLFMVLLIGLPLLLYILKRRIRPYEKLRGANDSETTLNIYREIVKQASRSGRGFDIDSMPSEIAELWPEIPEEQLQKLQTIVKAARYGKNVVSEACPLFLYRIYTSRAFERKEKKKTVETEEE